MSCAGTPVARDVRSAAVSINQDALKIVRLPRHDIQGATTPHARAGAWQENDRLWQPHASHVVSTRAADPEGLDHAGRRLTCFF